VNDIDLNSLCPGIRRTVAWLQSEGFHTTDSGDGYSNAEMECALPHANVFMTCDPAKMVEEADRLHTLLAQKGIEIGPLGPDDEDQPPHIEASYDPSNKVAVLCLLHLDDTRLFGDV
jgi:hypothetical protein